MKIQNKIMRQSSFRNLVQKQSLPILDWYFKIFCDTDTILAEEAE